MRKLCTCLPFLWNEAVDFKAKPLSSSPLDSFGFHTKCCWCVPLKIASLGICLLTMIWAILELITIEKFLKRFIDDEKAVYYLKIIYSFITIGLMIAAAILLLGILIEKYLFVNIYIWYVMVYTCLAVAFFLIGSSMSMVKTTKSTVRVAIKMALAIIWYAMVFYFLLIVNSYKSTLW